MILTHGTNSLASGGDFVVIGGRRYPVVKIGSRLWMAENLDYSDTIVTCSYPNNDSATYGYNGLKYGAYYNKDEYDLLTDYIHANVPDWHLATVSDLQGLDSLLGSSIGMDLCTTTGWSGAQGNDTYNFNLKPAGYINNYGTFTDEHITALLRTNAGHCWIAPEFTAFSYWDNDDNTTYFKFPVRLVSFDYGKVTIGGREYKTVKIGNQEWLAENLDWKAPGITVGTNAWYYNNDEATYGVNGNKYGLLYTWDACATINSLLSDGWRVPSTTDFDTLAVSVGGAAGAGAKLKSRAGWSSGNGDDSYGFAAAPAGANFSGFLGVGSYAYFWTSSENYGDAYSRYFDIGNNLNSDSTNKSFGISLRLVKDAT